MHYHIIQHIRTVIIGDVDVVVMFTVDNRWPIDRVSETHFVIILDKHAAPLLQRVFVPAINMHLPHVSQLREAQFAHVIIIDNDNGTILQRLPSTNNSQSGEHVRQSLQSPLKSLLLRTQQNDTYFALRTNKKLVISRRRGKTG